MGCARVSLKLHLFLRVQFPKNITDMNIHRKVPGKENVIWYKNGKIYTFQLVHFQESSLNQLQFNLKSHYLAEHGRKQDGLLQASVQIQHIWRIMFQRYSSGNQKLLK